MDSSEKLKLLENHIKALCPTFEVRFKDESLLMKTLGKVMFFNKSFMTHFITTLGTKVYFPNRQRYEEDSENSFRILAHEFVHIMDFMKSPWKFVFSYAAPQILAKLCIFSLLFFISPYFLLFLLSLLFLAPIPSIGRKNIEIRGYSMNCKIIQWCDECYPSDEYLDGCVENFTGPSYYFMYPFKNRVLEELKKFISTEDCLTDSNPAYREVYDIIKL